MKFERHIDAHYKNLYFFAFSLVKNEADAADFTQNAYLQLAKNWKKIRDKDKIKSWLYSTLYRDFIDTQRRKKFRSTIPIDIALSDLVDDSETHSDTLDSALIIRLLTELKESLRTPLTLYYLEDYTYKEISETLDIPIGTVMSRIHRGKQTLRDALLTSKKEPFSPITK